MKNLLSHNECHFVTEISQIYSKSFKIYLYDLFFDHGFNRLNGFQLRTNTAITLIVKGFHRLFSKQRI